MLRWANPQTFNSRKSRTIAEVRSQKSEVRSKTIAILSFETNVDVLTALATAILDSPVCPLRTLRERRTLRKVYFK
ncbi:hypothetical protein BJP36_39660 [Moorena producens JHB]|uniref:Uncharacterized protein n=1 Tax=Moorena producens (strain JHB) TaxID=1454205 RepID=A0A9Q9UWS8_MOOP1|nr:hypothetical protein [Moorena producens]WAN70171.1 hypothetical protein BJP36_39660 [Moorena producens JHB]